MSHPNQLALCKCAQDWIDQSQGLTDADAAARLSTKITDIQDKIHALSIAAFRDVEPPVEVAGLSVIDLMAAQSMLAVERAVRLRFAAMTERVAARMRHLPLLAAIATLAGCEPGKSYPLPEPASDLRAMEHIATSPRSEVYFTCHHGRAVYVAHWDGTGIAVVDQAVECAQ